MNKITLVVYVIILVGVCSMVFITYPAFDKEFTELMGAMRYKENCEKEPTSCEYITCMLKRSDDMKLKTRMDFEEKYIILGCSRGRK